MAGRKLTGVVPGLGRCTGKAPLGSCEVNKGVNKVEIIDLDDEDDVINIDDFEQPPSRGSSTQRKNGEFSNVIDIDDDDDDDTMCSVEELGDMDSDATSSKTRFSSPSGWWNSKWADRDECEVVQDRVASSNGLKGKHTHSSTAPRRNGYGLHSESESGNSADHSDCEVIESSDVLEHWQQASKKRKRVSRDRHSATEDQASGSRSHGDTVGVENRTGKHAETPVRSSFDHQDHEKDSPPDMATHDHHFDRSSFEAEGKESLQSRGDPRSCKSQTQHKEATSVLVNEEDQSSEEIYSSEQFTGKQSKQCVHNEVKVGDESFSTNSFPRFNNNRRSSKVMHEEILYKNKHSGKGLSDQERVEIGVDGNGFQSGINKFSYEGNVKSVPGEPLDETHMGSEISEDNHFLAVPRDSRIYVDNSEISNRKAVSLESVGEDSSEFRDHLRAENDNLTHFQNSIITDREKLKETDEYKQAMEEEMESRQQAVRVQQEEAQRLHKRKKAESMRLLAVQQRQTERVREVRETQKKDEENLNLKDKLRAEVRKELNRLSSCNSMSSLLRSLGIQVGSSGGHPLPHEVSAAYKRALLKFHPDRASKTDIRQMVESEEKFKLMSRMKEKLITTTWS